MERDCPVCARNDFGGACHGEDKEETLRATNTLRLSILSMGKACPLLNRPFVVSWPAERQEYFV